jgi:P-type E1-E2 ATPase
MLARLKKLGIRHTLMVTGDNKTVAAEVASKLGIETVVSEALPGDKIRAIEDVKFKPVAFVGDGVNDSPVLTASDVGIALGARGSTAASESADVVIMLDDVNQVAKSVDIAKKTFAIARQAIVIGIGMSIVLQIIFATGRFSPALGAGLQEVVDVAVIFIALRAHGSFSKPKLDLPPELQKA